MHVQLAFMTSIFYLELLMQGQADGLLEEAKRVAKPLALWK